MSGTRSLAEKLSQWDQLAVIALVIVLSQVAASLWLDRQRTASLSAEATHQASPALPPAP